jgi:hypothetical protein
MLNIFYVLKLSLLLISSCYRILNQLFYPLLLLLPILLVFFRIHTIEEEHSATKNISNELMNELLPNQEVSWDQIYL